MKNFKKALIACFCGGMLLVNSNAQIIFQQSVDALPSGEYTLDQLVEDFDVTNKSATGFIRKGEGENRVVIDAGQYAEASGKSLKVLYPEGDYDSNPSGAQWKTDLGGNYKELYLSYYVKFKTGFSFDKIGKLPGLAGGLDYEDRDGDTEWSGKLMWRADGKAQFYLHQPLTNEKQFDWIMDGTHAKFTTNKWHHIEIHYKVNSAGNNDGLMEAWLDGELVSRYTNFGLFTNNNSVGITTFFFSTFFGGNEVDAPDHDDYAWFDNFIVSTERIGNDNGGGSEPENQNPTVSITSPSNGASFIAGSNISIQTNASDSDGYVKRVEFYNNGSLIGTDYSDPFSYTISSASAGAYSLTAKAVDDDNATKTSSAVSFTVNASGGGASQSAYPSGVPHAIPGTINSTEYDNGGEGVAYHDASSGNAGSGPRQDEDVDLGTNNIGWISAGEWVEYTVDVEAGTYDIDIEVASATANGKFHIEFNGVDKTGVKSVNNTGGWGTYYTINISDVSLSGGEQVMRVYMDGKSFNLKNIVFAKQSGTEDPGDGDSGSDCSFNTPASTSLKSYDDVTFTNVHIKGAGGPSLSNVSKFRINYDAGANSLKRFAFNTSNGVPSYYNDLRLFMDHDFSSSNPDVTISGSGFSGFDGAYWVTSDGDNFVMASKSGDFVLYFSNSSTAPDCDLFKSAPKIESRVYEVSVYPNPVANNYFFVEGLSDSGADIIVADMLGKTVLGKTVASSEGIIDVSTLKAGSYILIIKTEGAQTSKLFNKL